MRIVWLPRICDAISSSLVYKQGRPAHVRVEQDVEVAVVVEVAESSAPADVGLGKPGARLGGHVPELSAAGVKEELVLLGPRRARRHFARVREDVTVRDENV